MASPPEIGPGEACELCGVAISGDHQHLVDLDSRSLLCSCRPCYLLFCSDGAGGHRYRAVPHRYLHSRDLRISEAQWDELQIPISIAFFFWNSDAGRMVAFYPSPAGATESLLPLEAWQRIAGENPPLRELAPDVEAILVRRREQTFEAFVVPIDRCYELVGRLRRSWKGFAGGDEAWAEIEAFFADLVARSAPAESCDGDSSAAERGADGAAARTAMTAPPRGDGAPLERA